ncbi:MAG: mandelate racemase/muconate lactonizing enzyme family protein [Acidimicrobiia bacterium]|nr:mandelate racemase/muconate lactonizing enzyme family protein [Acidimicrobiia bacterium]
MKIERVQSFLLSYPMPEVVKLDYYGGLRTIVKRDALLIRVQADNGLIGYAPGQGSEGFHERIEKTVAPFLQGRTLSDPDALRAQFVQGAGKDQETMKAYCAVEVALYDLVGKQLGVPVSELVGGRVRNRIQLYGSAGMYQPPEGYAAEAVGMMEQGFRAYKMRPALGPDEDLRTVELMRQAVGHGFDLMVDAHSWWRMGDRSYSYEMVEQLAREMGSHDIAWLEEPLPPADHAAYKKLCDTGYVAVASGEHEPNEEGFRDLILDRCVDYVQMDVVCQGGYLTCRRILSEVARQGQRFAFHCWGTDLEVMAAAQLGICWPETVVEWLEYAVYTTPKLKTMYPFPLALEILKQPLEIEHGELFVSEKPGLGVEVDESVVEKYPWIPGPWSFFRLDSPKQTFAVTSDHSVPWAGEMPA